MSISSGYEDVSIFRAVVIILDSNEGNNKVESLAVKISTEARRAQMFEGACVDSDAQQSVIGERQAELY